MDEISAYKRDETEGQRLDRNFNEQLQELRIAQTGVQILFAFLLTIPFQQRFTTLTDLQRGVYLVTLIAAAGVFNTVVLNTREKARDFAIFKAVGMTPRQVVTMVLASMAVLGVLGALVGIPSGIVLHRNIVILMGQIASSTGIPDLFFRVFGLSVLGLTAAAGIAIAMLGAMLPAQWAARSRVTEVLQTE